MPNEARVGSLAAVVAIEGDGTNAQARAGSQAAAVVIEGDGTNTQARIGSQAVMVVLELGGPTMKVYGFFGSCAVGIRPSGNCVGVFG